MSSLRGEMEKDGEKKTSKISSFGGANGFVSRVGDVDVPSAKTSAMPIWLSSGKRNGKMLEMQDPCKDSALVAESRTMFEGV